MVSPLSIAFHNQKRWAEVSEVSSGEQLGLLTGGPVEIFHVAQLVESREQRIGIAGEMNGVGKQHHNRTGEKTSLKRRDLAC